MPQDKNGPYLGELDRRVEIIKYTSAKSSTGFVTKTEESLGGAWAKAEFNSGNEKVEGKVYSINIRSYVLRYREDLVEDGENFFIKDIRDGGRFNILHIEQIGRKEYLRCKATRIE